MAWLPSRVAGAEGVIYEETRIQCPGGCLIHLIYLLAFDISYFT